MEKTAKLREHCLGMIRLLVVEFLVGMLTNLFVSFPENGNAKQYWNYAGKQGLVITHMIIGILLLMGAIVLVARSYKNGSLVWKRGSGIALLAILLAAASGSGFISTQKEVISFSMATFFIIALVAYGWLYYKTKP